MTYHSMSGLGAVSPSGASTSGGTTSIVALSATAAQNVLRARGYAIAADGNFGSASQLALIQAIEQATRAPSPSSAFSVSPGNHDLQVRSDIWLAVQRLPTTTARPATTTTRPPSTTTSTTTEPGTTDYTTSLVAPVSEFPTWLVPTLVVGGVVLVGSVVMIGLSRKKVAKNRGKRRGSKRRRTARSSKKNGRRPRRNGAPARGMIRADVEVETADGWTWMPFDVDWSDYLDTDEPPRRSSVVNMAEAAAVRAGYRTRGVRYDGSGPTKNARVRRNGEDVGYTIVQQLGGHGRLSAMIGAKNWVNLGNGVQFSFAGKRATGNKIVIRLNARDTYDVEFWWIRGADMKLVHEDNDVYNDSLRSVIESQTGMRLSLNRRAA